MTVLANVLFTISEFVNTIICLWKINIFYGPDSFLHSGHLLLFWKCKETRKQPDLANGEFPPYAGALSWHRVGIASLCTTPPDLAQTKGAG